MDGGGHQTSLSCHSTAISRVLLHINSCRKAKKSAMSFATFLPISVPLYGSNKFGADTSPDHPPSPKEDTVFGKETVFPSTNVVFNPNQNLLNFYQKLLICVNFYY